ncbi:MAG: hypothetical protein HKN16_10590 [Saprospiraceae bacterium]|nr:hypothetical protein [Saprospiraceae bacterium]
MKKILIGALVGGLILFIWQFISYGMANLHYSQMEYTDKQDEVLAALAATGLEEGTYFMPTFEPGTPREEMEKAFEGRIGKPWAQVSYHSDMQNNMGANMARGFVMNVIVMAILCWILLQFADLTFGKSVLASIGVGVIGYLVISYLNSIWFMTNSLPDLIDQVVQFGLAGSWLGWWLNR